MTCSKWAVPLAVLLAYGCKHEPTEPKAITVLRQNRDTMLALTHFQADRLRELRFQQSSSSERKAFVWDQIDEGRPFLCRRASFRVDGKPSDAAHYIPKGIPSIAFTFNGSESFIQYPDEFEHLEIDQAKRLGYLHTAFFDVNDSVYSLATNPEHDQKNITYEGVVTIDGVSCDRVRYKSRVTFKGRSSDDDHIEDIGRQDHLLHHQSVTSTFPLQQTEEETYYNIRLNGPIEPSVFKFKPSPGAKRSKQDN